MENGIEMTWLGNRLIMAGLVLFTLPGSVPAATRTMPNGVVAIDAASTIAAGSARQGQQNELGAGGQGGLDEDRKP